MKKMRAVAGLADRSYASTTFATIFKNNFFEIQRKE